MSRQIAIAWLLLLPCHLTAQSPGGVPGEELWFRNTTSTTNWHDLSGDNNTLRRWTSPTHSVPYSQPDSNAFYFNFNPVLSFPKDGFPVNVALPFTRLQQATVFGVFAPRHQEDSTQTFFSSYPQIVTSYRSFQPHHSVWGEDTGVTLTMSNTQANSSASLLPSFEDLLSSGNRYRGYIPELIAYQRILNPLERRQVETYLALRYGITLNGSYYDSNGNCLWDYALNTGYNHRITGAISDRQNNFYQPFSTTSHEAACDSAEHYRYKYSYDGNDPINQPSADHLLMMGKEYNTHMVDHDYLLWGDNDASTATYPEINDRGVTWNVMYRKWRVVTNLGNNGSSPSFACANFNVTDKGFFYDIKQTYSGSPAVFYKTYYDVDEAYIEFYCPRVHRDFRVGFCPDNQTTCQYGFHFDSEGNVYEVLGGSQYHTPFLTNIRGNKIVIKRVGSNYFLQIDGTGVYTTSFYPPGTQYRAIVEVPAGTSTSLLSLDNLRMSGSEDDGCQAVLNYALLADSQDFKRNRSGRVCMLVNPSGESDFSGGNIQYIPSSDFDIARSKLFFHNIFFNTEADGLASFTFGWSESLDVRCTPTEATCSGTSSLPNGKIKMEVLAGSPAYSYTVSAVSVPANPSYSVSGSFVDAVKTISGLSPGIYSITVSQSGGQNLVTSSLASEETVSTASTIHAPATVSWVVADEESVYDISFTCNSATYTYSVVGNVLTEKRNGTIIGVHSISKGDAMAFIMNELEFQALLNNNVLTEAPVASMSNFQVNLNRGNSKLYNFLVSELNNPSSQTSLVGGDDGLYTEEVAPLTFHCIVTVGSDCSEFTNGVEYDNGNSNAKNLLAPDEVPWSDTDGIQPLSGDSPFVVKRNGNSLTYTAELNTTGPALLLVYTAGGALIQKYDFGSGGGVRTCEFSLPRTGVFVVKALTEDNEYTYKIGGYQ